MSTNSETHLSERHYNSLFILCRAFAGAHYAIREFANVGASTHTPHAQTIIHNAQLVINQLSSFFNQRDIQITPIENKGGGYSDTLDPNSIAAIGDAFFLMPFGGGLAFRLNAKHTCYITDAAQITAGRFDDSAFIYLREEISNALLDCEQKM